MIPTLANFNDLHQAARTGHRSDWSDFHIIRNEESSEHQLPTMLPHRCDFHQVCLDLESDYTLGMDSQHQQTNNQQLIFLPKGAIVSWSSDHVDLWRGYTIFFKPEFLLGPRLGDAERLLAGVEPTLVQLDKAAVSSLSYLCERMLTEQRERAADAKEVIKNWLRLFLQYGNRYLQFDSAEAPGEMRVKYQFLELLSANVHRERSVSFYAAALNLSPRHFTRLVKRATGQSAKQLIQDKLIEVAKARLYDGRLSVSEVAFELGFSNIPQFSKVFKRGVGVSPSAYRRGLLVV